jgi:ATP phosphoribosyltransferase regulatory subunit
MSGRPELPAGVAPLFGAMARRRRALEEKLLARLDATGWEEVVLPVLDFLAPYEPLLGAAGRELYRFSDRDGETLALRADFTPMLARLLAPRLASLTLPLRCFYRGDVVRRREALLGGERELYQLGGELVGAPGAAGDAEALGTFLALLRAVTDAPLRVVLGCAGALDELLLAAPDPAALARAVARRERAAAREASPALLEVVEAGVPADLRVLGPAAAARVAELAELARRAAALPGVEVAIDLAELAPGKHPSLVSGGERPYYDGPIFRAWVGEDALPVGGGGRYDGLFAALGSPVPAVGFSLALDRLLAREATAGAAAPAPRLLRLALPKGRNLPVALAALRAAGLALDGLDPEGRRLWQPFPADDVEVLLLKDWDLPLYVERGIADVGVVGSDVLAEVDGDLAVPLRLRDGRARLSLVGPPAGLPPAGSAVRVATKYPLTARRALAGFPWAAEVCRIAGSVELAPLLALADLGFDVVQTGATLRAHGLAELAVVDEVTPCLVASRAACQRFRSRLNGWLERLEEAAVAV